MLDTGETNVGASADVLTAYQAMHQMGGIVIAAHANSSQGVAMRGMSFGGQTRIAYTQDPHLHALEVTDLDRRGGRTTASFFDGTKPEYPRRMRCIQGSDAHRTERDGRNAKNLGIGERITEVLLPELTFEALYDVFAGSDFARTRPFRGASSAPYDHVQTARQEGATLVQDFHESMSQRGGHLYAVIADIAAFANTNGGTLYVGVSADPKVKPVGVKDANRAVEELRHEIQRHIIPPVEAQVDTLQTEEVQVIRVQIPIGDDPPYAVDENKIYIRDEGETGLAVRDEIVQLVLRNRWVKGEEPPPFHQSAEAPHNTTGNGAGMGGVAAPRTGVEVVASEKRNNTVYHDVRDLRNESIVKNVTRQSARKLWHYAISQIEEGKPDLSQANWRGEIALLQTYTRGGKTRFDLAQRVGETTRVYYGVTEDGIQDSAHIAWRMLLGLEDDE
jgi:hypothetical protein